MSAPSANGGLKSNVVYDGTEYTLHTFTSNGILEVSSGGEMSYLIVGGGGAGGPGICRNAVGGGGGGGGVATGTFTATASNYSVVIGEGGKYSNTNVQSFGGGTTYITGTNLYTSAVGGGPGGCNYYSPAYLDGGVGACGGGGGADDIYTLEGAPGSVGIIGGKGANASYTSANSFYSGGGGGMGGAALGANGGPGVYYALTSSYYGGGGAGTIFKGNTAYPYWYEYGWGGTGGGANSSELPNQNGLDGYGGGGAGGNDAALPYYIYYPRLLQSFPSNGGNGVAIISYTTNAPPPPPTENSSLFFNNTGYVDISNLGSAMSTATEWTIETWMYIPSLPSSNTEGYTIFSTDKTPSYSSLGLIIYNSPTFNGNTYPTIWIGDGANSYSNIIDGSVNRGNSIITVFGWYHFALTYSSSTGYKLWQNGTNVWANSTTTSISSTLTNLRLGSWNVNASLSNLFYAPNCYIGMTRISNTIVYSTTYTPNTTYGVTQNTFYYFPFIGANGSTNFTANVYSGTSSAVFSSANAYTSTTNYPTSINSSLFFNKGGFVSLTSLGSEMTGATEWTIETWMYLASLPWSGSTIAYSVFSTEKTPNYSTLGLMVYNWNNTVLPSIWVGDGTTSHDNIINGAENKSNTAITVAGWNHFAVTYSNTSGYKLWQNGLNVWANSVTTSISSTLTSLRLGSWNANTQSNLYYAQNCYIGMTRISNTVVYNSTFIPNTTYGVSPNTFYYIPFTGANATTNFTVEKYSGVSSAVISSTNASISTLMYPNFLPYNPNPPLGSWWYSKFVSCPGGSTFAGTDTITYTNSQNFFRAGNKNKGLFRGLIYQGCIFAQGHGFMAYSNVSIRVAPDASGNGNVAINWIDTGVPMGSGSWGGPPSVYTVNLPAPTLVNSISVTGGTASRAFGIYEINADGVQVIDPRLQSVTDGLKVWLNAYYYTHNDQYSPYTSGTTWSDASGNDYNATRVGNPSAFTYYFTFNPASYQYVYGPAIGSLTNWTVECWANTTSSLSGRTTALITDIYTTSVNYCMGANVAGTSSSNIVCGFYDGSWHTTDGFAPTLNIWYQIVGSYDGVNIKQYVNGYLLTGSAGTLAYTGTSTSSGVGFRVAAQWSNTIINQNQYFYPGNIGMTRIYDRALSEAEVLNNFEAQRGPFGLISWDPYESCPLDNLSVSAKTTMKGAYSMKRLLSTYTGYTMKIRNGTSGATQDFYSNANGDLNTDINGLGQSLTSWLNGAIGYIDTWYDQSGSGNHATQTNTAKQPIVSQALYYLNFTTDKYFILPDGTVPGGTSSYTVTTKHGVIGNTLNGCILGGGTTGTKTALTFQRWQTTTYRNSWWEAQIDSTAYADNSTLSWTYNGSTVSFYKNGNFFNSVNLTARNGSTLYNRIGAFSSSNTYLLNGYLYFVLVFSSSLDSADRAITEQLDTF